MALRQVCCPTAVSVAVECFLNQGHRLQSPSLRPGEILFLYKKHSRGVSHQGAPRRDWTSCAKSGRTRAPLSRAALDDADTQSKAPREKRESAMPEMSTKSRGHSGQLQKKHEDGSKEVNIRPSLAIIVLITFHYVGCVLSFLPPHLHGYLGIVYTVLETVYRSNTVVRFLACLTLSLHVVESAYAGYLALKVDPDNVGRWVLWTAGFGVFVLGKLTAKANSRKVD